MQVHEAFSKLRQGLAALYDDRESEQIAKWVIEYITGFTGSSRLLHKNDLLNSDQEIAWQTYYDELLAWRPVQYVLGEAWFAGMKFHVDERVLIPRPETEELVEWVTAEIESRKSKVKNQQPGDSRESGDRKQQPAQHYTINNSREKERARILDIGTGSGCISISIKKKRPEWEVWAVDLSADALRVAEVNATNLGTQIHLVQIDILNDKSRGALPLFDIIVSNPPYIPVKDKNEMRENVLQYEPHLALFADDNDPLIFYREIIKFSRDHLMPGGFLFFEIHEQLAEDVMSLLSKDNYRQIVLKQDMQGKDRMIRAHKS